MRTSPKGIQRKIPNTEVIRVKAGAWLAQLEAGDLASVDIEALLEWIRGSHKHVAELRHLAKLSAAMNVLKYFAEARINNPS